MLIVVLWGELTRFVPRAASARKHKDKGYIEKTPTTN